MRTRGGGGACGAAGSCAATAVGRGADGLRGAGVWKRKGLRDGSLNATSCRSFTCSRAACSSMSDAVPAVPAVLSVGVPALTGARLGGTDASHVASTVALDTTAVDFQVIT